MVKEVKKDKRTKYESREAAKAAARKTRHQWDKENYERTTVYMPKGMNEQIQLAADKVGTSKRAFTIDAIKAALERTFHETE